jgi:methionine aminopeptidase
MAGNKYILQTGDVVKIDCGTSAKIDATLSIMEIT